MERRYFNLGKPPSKLRYFNLERAQSQRKGDVVRNIEECFDELDSSPEVGSQLSGLSPLSSSAVDEDGVKVQPLVLSLQIFESPLNSEGDGLIRTSSPIEKLRNEGSRDGRAGEDDIRASPLLFDKVYGDPDLQSELKEPSKCTDNAREPQEASSALNAHLVAEDPKFAQGSKVGPSKGGKEASGFLLKLKDAGRSKATSSWKQHSPVAVSAQPDPEEDFLIMDDEEFAVPDRIFIRKRPNPHRIDDASDCQQREVGEKRRVVQDGTEIPNEASSGMGSPTQTRTKTGRDNELQASRKTKPGRVQREKDGDLDIERSVLTKKTKVGKGQMEKDVNPDVERSVPTKNTKLGKVRSETDIDSDREVEHSIPAKKTKVGKGQMEKDVDLDGERSVPTKKTKLGKVRSENDIDSDREVEHSIPAKKTKVGKGLMEKDVDLDGECSVPTKKTKLGKVQSETDIHSDCGLEHSIPAKKTKVGKGQMEKDVDRDGERSVPTKKTKLGKVRSKNDIDSDRGLEHSIPAKKTKVGKGQMEKDIDRDEERSVPTKKTKLGKVRSVNDIDSDRGVEHSVPDKKTKVGKVQSENNVDHGVERSVPTKKTKVGKVQSENDVDHGVERSVPTKKTEPRQAHRTNDSDTGVEHSVSTKKTKSGKVARVPQIASTNQQGILTERKGKNSKIERAKKQAGRKKLKRSSRQNLRLTDATSGGPDDPGEDAIDQDAGRDSSWQRTPTPGEEEGSGYPQLTSADDPCKRQEGSNHSSDDYEGKRMRRKPGSWWLINQDGDEEGGDDAVKRGRGHQERVGSVRPNKKQRDRHASSKKSATGSSVEAVRNKAKEKSSRSCKQKPTGWPCPTASDHCHSTSQAADCEHMQNSESKTQSSRSPIQQGSQHGVQGDRLGNRCRKASSNWWEVPKSAAMDEDSGSPPHCSPKTTRRCREEACLKMPQKNQPPRRALNDTGNAWKRGNPKRHTQPAAWDSRNLPPPQNVRTSLASFDAIYTPSKAVTRGLPQRPLQDKYTAPRRSLSPVDDVPDTIDKLDNDLEPVPSIPTVNLVKASVVQTSRLEMARNKGAMLCLDEQSTDTEGLKGFRSGPSSFIEEEASENTRAQFLQNAMDIPSEGHMCNPPLSPIRLQVEDRAELVKWLNSVWCSPGGSPVITPEHFRWYGYHGKAMGCRTDLKSNTFSSGKILLGSYMKKPLQVDSQALSVYNILTSSLSVKINGVESCVSSGQTFMVPRGHPFEMRNLTAEPAVLFFHRMLSDAL
ncbi:uncharacterized protein [Paramormyrops kingsleyae]|uniref:uncharacterized protein isoform X2 n=1 Tax=Paramormyrops kingsleyae TaxID=1676925 RepID=UPI003B974F6A